MGDIIASPARGADARRRSGPAIKFGNRPDYIVGFARGRVKNSRAIPDAGHYRPVMDLSAPCHVGPQTTSSWTDRMAPRFPAESVQFDAPSFTTTCPNP